MMIEELLGAGMKAAKANDVARALKLLTQVVQTDPNSELGWLWLGLSLSNPKRRQYCFRRVLEINPKNTEARSQLQALDKSTVNSQKETTGCLS